VWLSTRSGGTTFASVKDDLVWQGYDRPNTKYVVFVDGGVKTDAAGQGDVQDDDSTGLNNQNNNGAMYAMAYLTNVDVDWLYDTVLHEIGHTMGAVQHSAPHSTAGWHCWDGLDTMCYDDDSARSERYTYTACPARYYGDGPVSVGALLPPPALGTGTEAALVFQMPHSYDAFDCGRDGYFNPHPTRWNYLCTHWNIAARYNRFVEFLAPQVAPPTSDYCY
jgi:hypothetical protein